MRFKKRPPARAQVEAWITEHGVTQVLKKTKKKRKTNSKLKKLKRLDRFTEKEKKQFINPPTKKQAQTIRELGGVVPMTKSEAIKHISRLKKVPKVLKKLEEIRLSPKIIIRKQRRCS